jgi:hypothetical protein
MEFFQSGATITNVVGSDWATPSGLSSPVRYARSILFPNKEYFVLIDRLEGTEPWIYRTIFRPTSLSLVPSTSTNTVGHVEGSLNVGGTAFNWLGLPYKVETLTGISTNSIKWTTRNPYGNNVNLEVFTSPAAEVRVEKLVGRIAGYDEQAEVFSPVISFRSPEAYNLFRVTALLSRYDGEPARSPSALTVTGQGSGVQVHTSSEDDYIYTGTGSSSFGPFSTDAATFYGRVITRPRNYTLIGGSYLNYSGSSLLRWDSGIDSITCTADADRLSMDIRTSSPGAAVSISQIRQDILGVTRDGAAYSEWTKTSDILTVTPGQGEHLIGIQFSPLPSLPPVMRPVGNKTANPGSLLSFTLSSTDPNGDTVTYGASGLPAGAVFSNSSGIFSWTPSAFQNGSYRVDFTASDGSLSDHQIITIAVIPVSRTGEMVSGSPEQKVTGEVSPETAVEKTTEIQPVATGAERVTPVVPLSPASEPFSFSQFGQGFITAQKDFLVEILHRSELIPGVIIMIDVLKEFLRIVGF